MMPPGGDVNTTIPLVMSIVCTLCCCLPVGVGGIVFSMQANTAKKNGDMVTAGQKAKTAMIISGVGMGLGLIVNAIYVAANMR